MYNDLWRRIVSVESLVKDLTRSGNATHREVLEEVRSLVLSDHKDSSGDSQESKQLSHLLYAVLEVLLELFKPKV